uniref:Secreted protein n=1 Tax=Macrostomum lignano TaxID=282301 RepID=A0A1I8F4I9_9PLAT
MSSLVQHCWFRRFHWSHGVVVAVGSEHIVMVCMLVLGNILRKGWRPVQTRSARVIWCKQIVDENGILTHVILAPQMGRPDRTIFQACCLAT